jgi:hypothetical protein
VEAFAPQDSAQFDFGFKEKVKESGVPTNSCLVTQETAVSKFGGTTATSNLVEVKAISGASKHTSPAESPAFQTNQPSLYSSVDMSNLEIQKQFLRIFEQRADRVWRFV